MASRRFIVAFDIREFALGNRCNRLLATSVLAASLLVVGCMEEDITGSFSIDGAENNNVSLDGTDDNVSSHVTDTVSLSWQRPETREDGSDLMASEIDRYEVFFGSSSGEYDQSIETLSTSAEISDLSEGKYYFAVKAYDNDGLASAFSDERSTTLQ